MKKVIQVAIVLLVAVSVSGCAGRINRIMTSWEGQHYSNLIASWGPPQQVFDDGSGGRLLVWTATRSWTTPAQATATTNFNATAYDNYIWGNATTRVVYTPEQTYGWTAYRMFWISSNGHIYRWAWRGL